MAQKKAELVVPEEASIAVEPVLDATAAELVQNNELSEDTSVYLDETTSPIVPIIAALASAGITALGFWIFNKIKTRKSAKKSAIVFDAEESADEVHEDNVRSENEVAPEKE